MVIAWFCWSFKIKYNLCTCGCQRQYRISNHFYLYIISKSRRIMAIFPYLMLSTTLCITELVATVLKYVFDCFLKDKPRLKRCATVSKKRLRHFVYRRKWQVSWNGGLLLEFLFTKSIVHTHLLKASFKKIKFGKSMNSCDSITLIFPSCTYFLRIFIFF